MEPLSTAATTASLVLSALLIHEGSACSLLLAKHHPGLLIGVQVQPSLSKWGPRTGGAFPDAADS